MEKKTYQQPETVVIRHTDPIMLDLHVSNGFVDDEAANSGTFDENETEGVQDFTLWDEDK